MNSGAGICRVCGEPVHWRSGLSNRVHAACRAKEAAKRLARPERATPAYKLTRAVSRHGATTPNPEVSKGNHRDRRLLDLAHRIHVCTSCGSQVETGCEPAHENGVAAGKGFAIKSPDHRHAALCHDCHAAYDQGPAAKAEKEASWNAAHKRTFDEYWRRGWIKVA